MSTRELPTNTSLSKPVVMLWAWTFLPHLKYNTVRTLEKVKWKGRRILPNIFSKKSKLPLNTSGKWEISDKKNDQNPHINDYFWFGDRWWLICGLLLHDQNWPFLFWSFIACRLVINLVIYLNQWPNIWPHLWPN